MKHLVAPLLFLISAIACPALTSHWEDAAQRETFVVEGDAYRLRVGTHPARIVSLSAGGREHLGGEGIVPAAISADGTVLVPAPRGTTPAWQVHTGQKMMPAKNASARMNVWRASPDYWEVHLRDIPLLPRGADVATAGHPLRAHLVIHAHPDRFHIELRTEPHAGAEASLPALLSDMPASEPGSLRGRDTAVLDGLRVLAPPGGGMEAGGKVWRAGAAAYWVFRTAPKAGDSAEVFSEEIAPPDAAGFGASGGRWAGYDPVSGLHLLDMVAHRPSFSFESAWKVASRRIETPVTLPGADRPRRITVMARTGTGNLEAGVVTDPAGFPRPIRAFVAKNFAGEMEEPDDAAFGDIIFPLEIGPGRPREHTVMALYQTWGRNMLKQVSSIRFFNIYWHLSHGLSETTCFTHAWMDIRGALVSIPDFRPYSGPFMMGQPQHDCFSWPGFLNYDTSAGKVRPMYRRTEFHSVAPCLAHFTMHFRTSDDAADMSVEVIEHPQTDEARTFLRLRYDWDREARISGDARTAFRWLQMFEKYPVESVLWLGADGAKALVPAKEGQLALAVPLAAQAPYAGAHGGRDDFASLMLVQRLKGTIGGRPLEQAHLTAVFAKDNGTYAFVHDQPALTLLPGDFIEADVLLMPHAEVTTPFHKPEREREHWALRPARVSGVEIGAKRTDFPADVRAKGDVARFRLTGGLNFLPLTASGFSAPGVPLLWREDMWQDQQHHGGDGYQVDAENGGTYRFTFNYPIRGTEEHDLTVTLLRTDAPVLSVRDANGMPVVRLGRRARLETHAPVLFAPGENRPEGRLQAFSGEAEEFHAMPVWYAPKAAGARIVAHAPEGEALSFDAEGSGGMLDVGARVTGAEYRVSVGGRRSVQRATGERLRIEVPAGAQSIRVEPVTRS